MLAAVAVGLAFAAPSVDVEGYHDKTDRIACVEVRPTAVRCGAKGNGTGLLLSPSGKAQRVRFAWRTDKPDIGHSEVAYGKTLALPGGLRCTFLREPSVRVRCRNDRYEIVVTRTQLIRRTAR